MTTPLHHLLAHQLRRLGAGADEVPSPERWRELLEAVSRTYGESERDRAHEHDQLSKSLAIHEATLEASPDGVLVVSADRRMVEHNKRFVELWGLSRQLVASRNPD